MGSEAVNSTSPDAGLVAKEPTALLRRKRLVVGSKKPTVWKPSPFQSPASGTQPAAATPEASIVVGVVSLAES